MSASPHTRRPRPLLIGGVILALVVLVPLLWWTVSPLFINTRVDEAFPTAAPVVAPAPTSAPATRASDAPTAPATGASDAPTARPTAPATGASDAPTAVPATGASDAPTAQPTAAPVEPVALSSGSFTFIDRLHWAEGSAVIYQLEDGRRILRLENFTAQNGPDLWIGLSGAAMPRSSDELHNTGAGYLELERLKANQGSQNYELPADLDLSAYKSVVIYCKAFSVVFSTADLTS